MVKCLAQRHKRRDRPGRDSTPELESNARDRSATTLYNYLLIRHFNSHYFCGKKMTISVLIIWFQVSRAEQNKGADSRCI